MSEPGALRDCHVVFFPASQARAGEQIAAELAEFSVLTVGEISGFAERGGIINFVIEDRHVRFEINLSAAERSNLRMSSKLLQLAIIVGKTAAH